MHMGNANAWTPTLVGGQGRLVGTWNDDNADNDLRFERRRAPRYAIGGSATLHATGSASGNASGNATHTASHQPEFQLGHRIVGVRLIDSSAGGLAILSETPLEIGTSVQLHFGGSPSPGRSGTVRRCDTIETDAGTAYRVGLDCGVLAAA